jgi:hypothetical protein
MASLPPKPLDSTSTQREERRHPIDDKNSHPVRPMASQSQARYRERPLSRSDRFYVPRTRPSEYNSYAPSYDRRREDDTWRRDYVDRERDRGQGVWERTGDNRDRERGSRFGEPGLRGYTRERGYERDRTHYSPPHDRHRDSYDRRDHRPSSPIKSGRSMFYYSEFSFYSSVFQIRLIIVHLGLLHEDDRFRLHPHTVPNRPHALTVVRHLQNE